MKKNYFLGILCIIGAILIFLNLFNLIRFSLNLWKIIGALFCLSIIINGIKERSFYGTLFGVAILFYLFRKELGFQHISFWLLFVATWLLAWGLSMIFHSKKKHIDIDMQDIEYSQDSAINISSTFGEKIQYIQTSNLKYITVDSKFSELKIYFDQANIENQATMEINANFTGIVLYIPKEWNVQCHVRALFGGINEKGQPSSNGYPILDIKGNINFGEIEIHYI